MKGNGKLLIKKDMKRNSHLFYDVIFEKVETYFSLNYCTALGRI